MRITRHVQLPESPAASEVGAGAQPLRGESTPRGLVEAGI